MGAVPTTHPRVNVTFDDATYNALHGLADSRRQSVSNVVRELVFQAMELFEDLELAKIAEERLRGKPKLIDLDDFDWGDKRA